MPRYCPACGKQNPDTAGFCSDCNSRLPGSVRGVHEEPDPTLEARAVAPRARVVVPPHEKPTLSVLSVVLAALGLGIPAILLGWYAIRRRMPGRGFALAGIALGSFATLVLAVILLSTLGRGDPLRRWNLRSDNVTAFVEAATLRSDAIAEQAAELRRRLGPGGEAELAGIYGHLNNCTRTLQDMELTDDEEELDEMRHELLDRLAEARTLLDKWR